MQACSIKWPAEGQMTFIFTLPVLGWEPAGVDCGLKIPFPRGSQETLNSSKRIYKNLGVGRR